MFHNGKHIDDMTLEEQLAKAEQVIANAQKHNEAMQKAMKSFCRLIDVEVSGRELTFKFMKDDEVFEIASYYLMGVDIDNLKKKAGLK
jgi:nitrous oxide reductase